jgi:excisionase family DNA binding protein
MSEPMFFNVEKAAKELQTTPDTVRRKAAEGSIPGRKVGRRWLFDPDQLKAYVRNEWQSTSERPGVPGGLDSQYAVSLFADPPKHSTEKRPKNSRPRSGNATGGKRN